MGLGVIITVVTLIITGVSLFGMFKVFGNIAKGSRERQRLLQMGTPAQGQIMAVQQTGTYLNNQPEVMIQVQVFPPNGHPYMAQVRQFVSMFEIPQYQVGAQVHVRIDPQNPSHVAIAPGAPMMAQPGMVPPMQQPGMPQAGVQPGMGHPGAPPHGYGGQQGGGWGHG